MENSAIQVSGLSKSYDSFNAVSNATFEVPRGTICGFVGPNGAGKTTTIRMLLGLISPTAGSGQILSKSIFHPKDYLSRVGAMIEGPAFYPSLTGEMNLRVLAALGGFPESRISELLKSVGLGGKGSSKYKTYSLGMKQRLGIAAALLPNPDVLILDEPTNGLDPEGIQEIRELIKELSSQGTTVFVSSHLLSEIEIICEHLVMLRNGKVLFSGSLQELLASQRPTLQVRAENKDDLDKVTEIAHKLNLKAYKDNDEVIIDTDISSAAQLNKEAFKAGVVLTQIASILPNLEETFFEMTGGTNA